MPLDWTTLSSADFWLWTSVFGIISYLIGSITFGRLVAKIAKKDLSKVGSGNVGATNAGRAMGAKGFILVLLGDSGKIMLTGIMIHFLMIHYSLEGSMPLALIFGVIGNNFPIWFKFKGGKGVAAMFGWAFIVSWIVALFGLLGMAIGVLFTRRVSMSSIIAVLVMGITATTHTLWIPNTWIFSTVDCIGLMLSAWIGAILVTLKHYKNIDRVLKKEEVTVDGVQELRWVLRGSTTAIAKGAVVSTTRAVKDTVLAVAMPHTIPQKVKNAYHGSKEKWKRTMNNIRNPKERVKEHVEHYREKQASKSK